MMNLIRNIRRKRKLAEIDYHRNKVAENTARQSELIREHGWLSIQDEIIELTVASSHHRYMIDHLKAQINA